MSQYVDSRTRTFTAGVAIAQYLRVKLSGGKLALSGAADHDNDLGVIREPAFADGDIRAVIVRTKEGTLPMVAAGAVTVGDLVYTAANGRVSTTSTGATKIGIALSAAGAAGDIIEVLPINY